MKVNVILIFNLLFISTVNANEDPYDIYHKFYAAIGGLDNLKAIKTSYSEGFIQVDHLIGRYKEWNESPSRYRLEEKFAVTSHTSGDNGQSAWSKDTNGKVLVVKDKDSILRRKITQLLNQYKHLDRNSNFFKLSYQEKKQLENRSVHVIKMTNTINKDINWLYFDSETFLLVKEVEKQPDLEIHIRYQDYQFVDGNIKIAYQTNTEFKPRDKHSKTVISKFIANPAIPAHTYATPSESLSTIVFKNHQKENSYPFQLVDNLIYFPLQVNGKEDLWILDSGASMSIIDENYAKQQGLKVHPGITGFGFGGNFNLSYVNIPSYGTSNFQIKKQTIYALKDLSKRFPSPQAMGILGYDFLSRFVVKIDYLKQSISFYDNKDFKYQDHGAVIPAPIKYNTFTIPVILNGNLPGQWSIDLGAYDASLSYDYAKKHRLLNLGGEEIISQGLSSSIIEHAVKFESLEIGPYLVQPVVINIPDSKQSGSSSHGELAGNIGNSVLRHFILYLDYKNQQIILQPLESSDGS